MRAAIFDVLDVPVPWSFRDEGDERERMAFVDAVEQRLEELELIEGHRAL